VVILCGGRGTRLQEHTRSIPKPMVEIGGRPILWHVLQIYLAQGFRRFLLLTGYLGEEVDRFAASEPWPADAEIAAWPPARTLPPVAASIGPPMPSATVASAWATGTAWPISTSPLCWPPTPSTPRRGPPPP
jgi:hypothetical protein